MTIISTKGHIINQSKAYAAVILQVLIIGLSFMFVKVTLRYASPFDTLAHRFTIAFLVATIPLVFGWVRFTLSMKSFLVMLPLAIFYPSLFFAFQTFGLVYTTSSEAGIIFASVPILVALLSAIILKERTTLIQALFIILSVIGVVYIVLMQRAHTVSSNYWGMGLIFLSAFSTAIYTVLTRKFAVSYSGFTLMYVMTFLGFLFFNALALGMHALSGSWGTFFTPFSEPTYLLSILYLAIPSSIFTLFLAIYALARLEAFKVGVFNNLATLITIAAGVLFLNESLYYYHIIGTVIILTGVIGSNYFSKKM